jgi:peptidoglycan hydrolase FlgJ
MTDIAALPSIAQMPTDLLGDMPTGSGAGRIEQTGQQFEALFLSLLLKEMRQTLESDGLFPGDPGDIQGGLFDLYLGKHMAESGGVGLADSLNRILKTAQPANATDINTIERAFGTALTS